MEIASLLLSVVAVLVAGISALYTRRQAAEAGKSPRSSSSGSTPTRPRKSR